MDVVYASTTAHVTSPDGARMVVQKGSHWPADDPIVRAQPSLFSSDPRYGLTYSAEPAGWDDPQVETATAVPGERRNARRG